MSSWRGPLPSEGVDTTVDGARIALVHDYLTQRGGAERVALSLKHAFPGARLLTSIYNPATTFPDFEDLDVEQTWLGRVPAFRADPRRAFPFLAPVYSSFRPVEADVVICSTSGWAHGVRTHAPKVVYCHNPPRWLHQPHDYLPGVPRPALPAVRAISGALKVWDRHHAVSATTYVANSSAVRDRIRATYGRDATVVFPPRGVDPDGPMEAVPGVEPGYLLHVGRPRGYKNADAVCRAVAAMPSERLVSVGGLPEPDGQEWPDRIVGLTDLNDAQMRWLYAHCDALVALSHEDFGLTPVEAYAFGRPAVVLRAGGYLDSTLEGVTGVFAEDLGVDAVTSAIRALRSTSFDVERIKEHGERFSPAAFAAAMRAVVGDVLVGRSPQRPEAA